MGSRLGPNRYRSALCVRLGHYKCGANSVAKAPTRNRNHHRATERVTPVGIGPNRLEEKGGAVECLCPWYALCRIEMPWFVEMQDRDAAEGLQVVGVAMDASSPNDRKWSRTLGWLIFIAPSHYAAIDIPNCARDPSCFIRQ